MMSLGARLGVFVSAAVVPLLVLLIIGAIADRMTALETARSTVMDLATLGAVKQGAVIEEAHEFLKVLRRMEDITAPGSAICHAAVQQLAADHPQFVGVGVVAIDGMMRCHNKNTDVLPFQDVELFNQIMASDQPSFALGKFQIGLITGKPIVMTGMVLPPTSAGTPRGMVFASLNLASLSRIAAELTVSKSQIVMVIDPRTGTVLAQEPDPRHIFGQSFPDEPLIKVLREAPGGGTFDGKGLGGTPRIFGFAALQGIAKGGPMLVVGLSRDKILGDANRWLAVYVLVAILTTVGSWSAAMLLGRASLSKTMGKLVATASRFGRGDLLARASLEPWRAPELRLLASSLNDMATRVAEAQALLTESESELRLLADNSNDLIIKLDPDFRRIYVSPSVREILGYEPQKLTGPAPPVLLHPEDFDRVQKIFQSLAAETDRVTDAHRLRHRDGRWIWFESSLRRLRDRETGEFLGILTALRDITRRKEIEDELSRANDRLQAWALQDGLTGLANRRSFDEILDRECRRAVRESVPLGLIMADVDNFKIYNDRYGHQRGDDCLCAVAQAIRHVLDRPGDVAARYGGEEFAVILPNTDEAGTAAIAGQIRSAVEALGIDHSGSPSAVVTISAGSANQSDRGGPIDPRRLIEVADRNLYAAKMAGRNRVVPGLTRGVRAVPILISAPDRLQAEPIER